VPPNEKGRITVGTSGNAGSLISNSEKHWRESVCLGHPDAPDALVITGLAKMKHIIFTSCEGICEEDDFRLLREKEARTSGGEREGFSWLKM
jgi:hypothetical protein